MTRFAVLFVLVAALFSACNTTPETPKNEETEKTAASKEKEAEKEVQVATVRGYAIGDIAEDFSLKNVDGKMVSMADYKDAKGFVVVFTCNHCPYSIAYEDRLIKLNKEFKAKGYPMIAINPNDPNMEAGKEDSYELMQVRAKEKGFNFPYLFDEGQKVFPKYGATKTPHCYVLQKSEAGLKVAYIGAVDDSKDAEGVSKTYLADAINALLAGKQPEPAETKAIGCGIKCKDESKLKKS